MLKRVSMTKTQARTIAARWIASQVASVDLSTFENTSLTAEEAAQVIDAIQERAAKISDTDKAYAGLQEIINDVLK